ncbi:MAG TPA: hypothetical protein VFE63_09995 [Roseiarcus sp.]|nr:hypothetical protein [Roseiarcus sp.]
MKPLVSMRAALADPDLFGSILAGESWAAWRVWLIAIIGEALTDEERVVFHTLTGREHEPGQRADEACAICGRRSGKTRAASVLAAYVAALCDHSDKLAPGERGTLPIMSASMWQAAKALQYLDGIFGSVPALKSEVIARTADTLSLRCIDIECRPASFRTIRGGTAVAVIADEVAYWRNEETSRNPDKEILDAARPALATTGGPLIIISSPYAQRGELWNTFRRDFGPEGDPLIVVARAPSRAMNPTLPQRVVDRAYERDPLSARAEYDAEFRSDVTGFADAAIVEQAVARGVVVRAPLSGQHYVAFVDPSGGSSDSMTLAVAHAENNRFVLDLAAERRAPFSPDSVVAEFVATLKAYRVSAVTGDRYAGEWPREAFAKHGITYEPSEQNKSDIYLTFLPLLNSGRVDLLDSPRLIAQLTGLERRTARGGRDSVDHAPGAHDDVANSVAGALVLTSAATGPMKIAPELMAQVRRRTEFAKRCRASGADYHGRRAPVFFR